MNQQDVMREAARLSAQRRRRVTTTCAVCSKTIEGTVRRRFGTADMTIHEPMIRQHVNP